ncbi:hypothetical protein KCU98_g5404, partial [Aureobasidium melanogenum]
MICADNNLALKDLAAMRLTSKELHAVATHEFAKRYFRDPFVMMSRESLQRLVEICKHPIFGPQVQKVQLLNNFFDPEALETFAAEMAWAYTRTDLTRRPAAKREMKRITDLVAEQCDVIESGAGLTLLRETFKIIGAQGRSVAIASQRFSLSHHPIGWSEVAQDFREDNIPDLLGKPEALLTTRSLLEAAQASGCDVTELVIGVDCFRGSHHERSSRSTLDSSLLRNLLEFNFEFQWRSSNTYHNELAQGHLAFFLRILPQSLKTLVVCSDAEGKQDVAEAYSVSRSVCEVLRPDALKSMQPNALENIHLSKVFVRQRSLLLLLKTHSKTLKKLVLSEVYLSGDWDQVLSHIAAKFSLNHFVLQKAFKVTETQIGPFHSVRAKIRHWYSRTCELKGTQGICQDLNKFVELQGAERRAKGAGIQA